jgi:hypothetical protein
MILYKTMESKLHESIALIAECQGTIGDGGCYYELFHTLKQRLSLLEQYSFMFDEETYNRIHTVVCHIVTSLPDPQTDEAISTAMDQLQQFSLFQ